MNDPRIDRCWYAVYVKPRNEKKVAERLADKGFEVYLPLQETVRQWSDRKKKVEVPVLPSYVFLKVRFEKDRDAVLEEPSVSFFIYWLGKPAVIREREIMEMRRFLEEYEDVQAEDIQKNIGSPARITHGAFKDQEGTIIRTRGNRVILQIESIGFQLSAEVHPSKIEILKKPRS